MAVARYPESGGAYRTARLGSGLSQEALARAAEVNRRHLIRIENGENRPRPELRDRIASILGVDPTSLPAAGEDPFVRSERGGLALSEIGSPRKFKGWFKRRST